MPMYYFNLNDDDTVVDTDGTDLPDLGAAHVANTEAARQVQLILGASVTQRWLLTFQGDNVTVHFANTDGDKADLHGHTD